MCVCVFFASVIVLLRKSRSLLFDFSSVQRKKNGRSFIVRRVQGLFKAKIPYKSLLSSARTKLLKISHVSGGRLGERLHVWPYCLREISVCTLCIKYSLQWCLFICARPKRSNTTACGGRAWACTYFEVEIVK